MKDRQVLSNPYEKEIYFFLQFILFKKLCLDYRFIYCLNFSKLSVYILEFMFVLNFCFLCLYASL